MLTFVCTLLEWCDFLDSSECDVHWDWWFLEIIVTREPAVIHFKFIELLISNGLKWKN